mgnify:CR=1 FL=1
MLDTRERLLNGALRRAPVGVRDVPVIRPPIAEILARVAGLEDLDVGVPNKERSAGGRSRKQQAAAVSRLY